MAHEKTVGASAPPRGQDAGNAAAAASRSRRRSALLWTLAVLITLAAAVYQRLIGPTRPLRGSVTVAEATIDYRLDRSHGGPQDHEVRLEAPGGTLRGTLVFRRYKTSDPWTLQPMTQADGELIGTLPHQPPAGKLVYRIYLEPGGAVGEPPHDLEEIEERAQAIPPDQSVVLRFRGGVPMWAIIPHVLFMFAAMLWSNRAGIEALRPAGSLRGLTIWSFVLMILGGLVFGPIVQWYAFGAAWTGFPVGHDLTDNKTLIAFLAWLAALIAVLRSAAGARYWVLGAALVTLVIFSIPHSVLGSELDYGALPEPPNPAAP